MNSYKVLLKVSDTSGRRIEAVITNLSGIVRIETGYIRAVEKDNPTFSKKGKIRMVRRKR